MTLELTNTISTYTKKILSESSELLTKFYKMNYGRNLGYIRTGKYFSFLTK